MYWEFCSYVNESSAEECASIGGGSLQWNEEDSLCGFCVESNHIGVTLLDEEMMCIMPESECQDVICASIVFFNDGNSATGSFIRDQYQCEDLNGCKNTYYEQECLDAGFEWKSPSCRTIQLNR